MSGDYELENLGSHDDAYVIIEGHDRSRNKGLLASARLGFIRKVRFC